MKERIEFSNFELIIDLFRKVISSLSCIEKKTKDNDTRCICSKYLNDIINQYDNYKMNKNVNKICFKCSEKEVVDFCNDCYEKVDIFEFAEDLEYGFNELIQKILEE